MTNCTFSDILGTECYSPESLKRKPPEKYQEPEHDKWMTYMWKACGKKTHVSNDITICQRHKQAINRIFSHNVWSDPIDVHKQTSTAEPKSMKKKKAKPKARGHLKRVSLDFAVQLHDIDITNIIPDQKLCYDCRTSLTNKLKNAELNIQNQNSDSQHSISSQASQASLGVPPILGRPINGRLIGQFWHNRHRLIISIII